MPTGAIVWLSLMIIFIIIEANSHSLVSLWFAVGSLAAVITVLFTEQVWVQLVVFAVISGATLALLRPLFKAYLSRKKRNKIPDTPTNSDRNIGQVAVCVERIDNSAGVGAVRLLGKEWSARTQDGSIAEIGENVKVMEISGAKLIVLQTETAKPTA